MHYVGNRARLPWRQRVRGRDRHGPRAGSRHPVTATSSSERWWWVSRPGKRCGTGTACVVICWPRSACGLDRPADSTEVRALGIVATGNRMIDRASSRVRAAHRAGGASMAFHQPQSISRESMYVMFVHSALWRRERADRGPPSGRYFISVPLARQVGT